MEQMGQERKRREVVEEYERGGVTMGSLARKYGVGKATVHRWVKASEAVGGIEELERIEERGELTAKTKKRLPIEVKELQKELEEARMYNDLLNAMIDIAEEQMGVAIRKKAGAKQ